MPKTEVEPFELSFGEWYPEDIAKALEVYLEKVGNLTPKEIRCVGLSLLSLSDRRNGGSTPQKV